MSTSKLLQTPQILSIEGSTLKIAHPDISDYTRTELASPIAASGVTATILDNNNFADNDWFITGEAGDSKTEEGDVNGAVTRGTSLTITNTNKFAHEIHAPMTKILERGFAIYGAATDGGTGTLITSIDAKTASANQLADAIMIQWNKAFSEYTLISTDTTYAYYYVKFTDGTTSSSVSDYVLAAGLGASSASEMVKAGLREVNAEIDGNLITEQWLLDVVNDFQDEVTHYVTKRGATKDWSFEITEDKTSISATQNEVDYALSGLSDTIKYTESNQAIIHVKFGADSLDYLDLDLYGEDFDGLVRTAVKTQAVAGDTSIVLDDTYELAEAGTAYIGADTITYTGNTESTGTLTGIPASGTGSITETQAVDTVVWQGVSPGLPDKYTVFNGNISLNKPVNEANVGKKIKLKYLKELSRLTSMSEATEITFPYLAKYFIASRIESRKKNTTNSDRLYSIFLMKLEAESSRDNVFLTEQTDYYTFIG